MSLKLTLEPEERSVQIAIRIPASWLDRAAKLAKARSGAGLTVTRTDALRVAMGEGLTALERGRK